VIPAGAGPTWLRPESSIPGEAWKDNPQITAIDDA
jgi:hypothetical protein